MSKKYDRLPAKIRSMVDDFLLPGEEVVWKGRQGSAPGSQLALVTICVAALLLAGCFWAYTVVSALQDGIPLFRISTIVLILAALAITISLYRNFTNTATVITNRRVIKAYRKVFTYTIHGTGFKGICDVKIINKQDDGTADVVFYYIDGRTGHRPWGFLHMENADEVRAIALEQLQRVDEPCTLPAPAEPVYDKVNEENRSMLAGLLQPGETLCWAGSPSSAAKAGRGRGRIAVYAITTRRAITMAQNGTVAEEFPLHSRLVQDHAEHPSTGNGKLVFGYDVKDMSDFPRQHERGFLHLRNVRTVAEILSRMEQNA